LPLLESEQQENTLQGWGILGQRSINSFILAVKGQIFRSKKCKIVTPDIWQNLYPTRSHP